MSGKVAYEAYCNHIGGLSLAWGVLTPKSREAWEAAAEAVRANLFDQFLAKLQEAIDARKKRS